MTTTRPIALLIFCAAAILAGGQAAADDAPPIKVGMIGLDTSHALAFPRLFKAMRSRPDVPAIDVVAGCPMSVADNPASYKRVKDFTEKLKTEFNLTIVDSIEALLPLCDGVMVMSVDGRPHLSQARPALEAGKPVFIDKPLAGSFADAKAIVALSKKLNVPFFSASALRFVSEYRAIKSDPGLGKILGCAAFSPCGLEPHHPDLYWYGIHGVDPLFMIMGKDCEEVWRISTPDFDVAAGRWSDGRIGTFRGMRKGPHSYGLTVWGDKGMRHSPPRFASIYEGIVKETAIFFRTRKAPVDPEETLAVFAFMTAADLSKQRGGKPVKLAEILGPAQK